jgi:hypothetical protein
MIDVAYFLLHFVPRARQIISQLVRNETTSSAEAAAAADDVRKVNAFSSALSDSSLLFIFVFGGIGTGRESVVCSLLVSATGPPAVVCSLLTIRKISTLK